MNNNYVLQLKNGSDSSAIVHYTWTPDTINEINNCKFTVHSNLYLPSGETYARGIFATIKKINLRKDANGKCIDYVSMVVGDWKVEVCEQNDNSVNVAENTYLNGFPGIAEIHVFIDKSKTLNVKTPSLELELLFTAYDSKIISLILELEKH